MQKIKNQKSKIKNQKGFTLIELLIVIAIIGLLTTVSVIAFTSVRAQARDAQRASDAATVRRALEMYLGEGVGYPPSAGECLSGASGVGADLISKNAINAIPFDPLWRAIVPLNTNITNGIVTGGSNFCYYYFSNSTDSFSLSYYMEEGNPNSGHSGIHVMDTGGDR
jgi:prepilin-type N-terminal cleavage/methylation domain-containing protein